MKNSRERKLTINTISSLMLQVTTIISGFIVPKLILIFYGSDINGLVSSITQFLGVISFLEFGVGEVVQSALYKPLLQNDQKLINQIITSSNKFFKYIADILILYIGILIFVFPMFIANEYPKWITIALILGISINMFAQYYFGITDSLLITADQRGYIQYISQTIAIILNTLVSAILIYVGTSIQTVKFVASCIYLLRPITVRLYINKNYNLNRKEEYDNEPIKQKWNGLAQHLATFVLNQTDTIILTLFSTLANVSIYSVYNMVVYGVSSLIISLTNGFRSLMGEMIANNEKKNLMEVFKRLEWMLHTITIFSFGCTSVLIIPFVKVYTKGIYDANYIVPLFAFIISTARAFHCIRLPYNTLVLSSGHYKQTQNSFIGAVIINLVISLLTVSKWGLCGVAFGTLCSMFYHSVWLALYGYKNILFLPVKYFARRMVVTVIIFVLGYLSTIFIEMKQVSYMAWIILSIKVVIIWLLVLIITNCFFYKTEMLSFFKLKNDC